MPISGNAYNLPNPIGSGTLVNNDVFLASLSADLNDAAAAITTILNNTGSFSGAAALSPMGYLTLSSDPLNVMPQNDITAATSVFYTPYKGNLIPIYDGSTFFVANPFSQLTLTLTAGAHLASTIYDVFAFLNNGVVTIGTGPAWTNSGFGTSARGTGAGTTQISLLNGLWVNTAAITATNGASTFSVPANQGTYLGSIYIDTVAGQVSVFLNAGQNRKWGTWSCYNRQRIRLLLVDTTASTSYNYQTNTWRPSHNDVNNNLITFTGLPEEVVDLRFNQNAAVLTGANTLLLNIAIGFDDHTVSGVNGFFGELGTTTATTQISGNMYSIATLSYVLGVDQLYMMEIGSAGGGTGTWFRGSQNQRMEAFWDG